MKRVRVLAIIACMMAAVNFASADTIRGIGMDFVTIGNPGNLGDTTTEVYYSPPRPYGCGAVSYRYRIGKYEVTADQWQTVNNAAGINDTIYWSGDQPVAGVSWYDAARFCNYLTTGDTEDGVYKFSGGSLTDIMDHEQAGSTYGTVYFMPTEDEWYKAAYYKPDGSDYSVYANGWPYLGGGYSGCNYGFLGLSAPWNIGTGAQEQNGTFDMMGNVYEWNETLLSGTYRGYRGGSFADGAEETDGVALFLRKSDRFAGDPYLDEFSIGFRVASIPEPATLFLLTLGGLFLRRK